MAGTSAPSGGFRDAHLDNCSASSCAPSCSTTASRTTSSTSSTPPPGASGARATPPVLLPRRRGGAYLPAALFSVARGAYPYLNLQPSMPCVYLCQRPLHPRTWRGRWRGDPTEPRLAISTRGANLTRALRHLADLLPPVQLRRRLPGAGVVARRRHVVPERALRVARIRAVPRETPRARPRAVPRRTRRGLHGHPGHRERPPVPRFSAPRRVRAVFLPRREGSSRRPRRGRAKTLARPWGWIVTIAALAWRRDDTRGRGVFRRDAAVGVGDETVRNRGRDAGGGRASPWSGRRGGCFFDAAAFVGAGFASIVPSERTWYTAYGSRTMYAFLLHPLVARGTMSAFLGWAGSGAGRGSSGSPRRRASSRCRRSRPRG